MKPFASGAKPFASGAKTFASGAKTLASVALAAAVLAGMPVARGEFRHALVIGQSTYKTGTLAAPPRDVVAVAGGLERRGFTVTRAENLATVKDLDAAVKAFAKTIPTNGTAVVYVSGQAASMPIASGTNPPRQDIGILALDGGRHPLGSVLTPLVVPQASPFTPDGRQQSMNDLFKQGVQSGSRVNVVILDTVLPPAPAASPAAAPAAVTKQTDAAPAEPVPLLGDSLVIQRPADQPAEAAAPSATSPLAERLVADLASDRPLDAVLGGLSARTISSLDPGELARLSGPASRAVSPPDTLTPGPRPGAEWVDRHGIVFCWCPPGEFTIGSPAGEGDREPDEPQAVVTFADGFWMAKYELTYRDTLPLGALTNQATGDHKLQPVNAVARQNYAAFFKAANATAADGWEYGLPTEAEWEYAARAGTQTAYSFGDDPAQLALHGNFADKTLRESRAYSERAKLFPPRGKSASFGDRQTGLYAYAHPAWNDGAIGPCRVGNYRPNAWGLHDVHGNLSELTCSVFEPWRAAPVLGVAEIAEWLKRHDNRWYWRGLAARGGHYGSLYRCCRSAFRGYGGDSSTSLGMRLVLRRKAAVLPPLATEWTPLVPSSVATTSGAMPEIAADGAVLLTGTTVPNDTYMITCPVPAGIEPRQVRLECLADPTLPKQGPGRGFNGASGIAEFSVAASRGGGSAAAVEVLDVITDDADLNSRSEASSFGASLVDGKPDTAGLTTGDGKPRQVVFMIALPSRTGHDGARWRAAGPPQPTTSLVVTIAHAGGPLGKFRLSALHEMSATASPEATK